MHSYHDCQEDVTLNSQQGSKGTSTIIPVPQRRIDHKWGVRIILVRKFSTYEVYPSKATSDMEKNRIEARNQRSIDWQLAESRIFFLREKNFLGCSMSIY
jgi:hypothetical protein